MLEENKDTKEGRDRDVLRRKVHPNSGSPGAKPRLNGSRDGHETCIFRSAKWQLRG